MAKVKSVTINLKKSKEILANKITDQVNKTYQSTTSLAIKNPAYISKEVMVSIL